MNPITDRKQIEQYAKNPQKGMLINQFHGFIMVVLDFNEDFVLVADKKIEVGPDCYRIDYAHPSIITRDKFEEIASLGGISINKQSIIDSISELEKNGSITLKLPTTHQEAIDYFTSIESDKETFDVNASRAKPIFTNIERISKEFTLYSVLMKNGCRIRIEEIADSYSFVVKDKEGVDHAFIEVDCDDSLTTI